MFLKLLSLLFLKSYEMSWDFWQTLSLLPCCFMVFIFLFTSNMGNMKRGSSLLSHFQAQGKGDPLGGPLFSLAHYRTFLKIITQAPKCVFPSLVDDTHIVGTMNKVVIAFNHLLTQLTLIGLKVNMSTCKLWSPLGIFSSVNFF
jgi:hypothetical protein